MLPDVPVQERTDQQILQIIINKQDHEAKVQTPSTDVGVQLKHINGRCVIFAFINDECCINFTISLVDGVPFFPYHATLSNV